MSTTIPTESAAIPSFTPDSFDRPPIIDARWLTGPDDDPAALRSWPGAGAEAVSTAVSDVVLTDPLEIAYVAGGPSRVVLTALAVLHEREVIDLVDAGPAQIAVPGRNAAELDRLDPIERHVAQLFMNKDVAAREHATGAGLLALVALRDDLVTRGLILREDERRYLSPPLAAAVAIVGAAVVIAAIALHVDGTMIVGFVVAVVAAAFAKRGLATSIGAGAVSALQLTTSPTSSAVNVALHGEARLPPAFKPLPKPECGDCG